MSAYEPLHHKYRPQTFADLVGQDAIAQTLTNAINRQRIAPAYLFAGPRGTGKTSSARILAKSLNCLSFDAPTPTPCGECEVCLAIARGSALDVMEIDAASNTGVDNIREIIERAQFAPVQCRYKVYVIDECHMLSTAAFNALLKTLEEPPDRVIFVLATTDPQRVLPTIASRCQRFDYRRISLAAMVNHLAAIARTEAIAIDADALTLVAQLSNGGLRDAESLLDQLSLLSGSVTPEKVWDLVGSVSEQDLLALLQAIQSSDPEIAIATCRQILDRGREPLVLLQNLAAFYLNLLIAKSAPQRHDMAAVTGQTWQKLCELASQWQVSAILKGQQYLKDSEIQIRNATQPRLWLEVTILGLLPGVMAVPASSPISPSHAVKPIPSPSIPVGEDAPSSLTVSAPSAVSFPPPPEPVPQPSLSPTPSNGNGFHPSPAEANGIAGGRAISPQPTYQPATIAAPSDSADLPSPSELLPTADCEDIWQQVLEQLQPMTKALLQSHCRLLCLEGKRAKVGVKNETLLRHAHNKLTEVEAAFTQICQQATKVHFLVSEDIAQGKSPSSQSPIAAAVPARMPVSQSPTRLPTPPREPIPTAAAASVPKTIPVAVDSGRYSSSELRKAVETVAKLFEGEIIELDEPETDSPSLSPETTASQKKRILGRPDLAEIADDEDIPF
jgi:DNA polymerase-3 subunit gamma/tau